MVFRPIDREKIYPVMRISSNLGLQIHGNWCPLIYDSLEVGRDIIMTTDPHDRQEFFRYNHRLGTGCGCYRPLPSIKLGFELASTNCERLDSSVALLGIPSGLSAD